MPLFLAMKSTPNKPKTPQLGTNVPSFVRASETRRVRAAFIAICTRSLFPAFVAFVGALAGLAASVYSSELKAAIPLLRKIDTWSTVSGDAIMAGVLFLAFFVLYALQQSAKNMQEADARKALFAETERLKQLVARLETLPPDGFLQQFQSLYQGVAKLQPVAFNADATPDDAASALRSILKSIAALAHKFDNAPDGSYTANLMVCHSASYLRSLNNTQRDSLEQRLIFCPELPSPKLAGLRAVLTMVPEISSDFDETSLASQVPSIVLPIPLSTAVDLGPELGVRSKLIPGAPFAAVTHRYAAFDSIRAMLDWCRNRSDTTRETLSELTAFFHNGQGATVKSFISIPICVVVPAHNAPPDLLAGLSIVSEDKKSIEICLGVLNIHSKNEGILGGTGYPMFVPIIEPFVTVLAMLLTKFGESLSTPPSTTAKLASEPEKQDAH